MSEEIDRWIKFMRQNSCTWKRIHTEFIKSEKFIQRLLKEPAGREKIIAAYKIKNLKGYEKLLKKNS